MISHYSDQGNGKNVADPGCSKGMSCCDLTLAKWFSIMLLVGAIGVGTCD